MSWGKRAGKLVLLLLLAELLFFFFVGLRLRRRAEAEREILGAAPAAAIDGFAAVAPPSSTSRTRG
jgi:hypothetical protein